MKATSQKPQSNIKKELFSAHYDEIEEINVMLSWQRSQTTYTGREKDFKDLAAHL